MRINHKVVMGKIRIIEELELLDRKKGTDSDDFCILEKDNDHFIQCFLLDDGSYELEYHEDDSHFTLEKPQSFDDVSRAFLSYHDENQNFKNEFAWVPDPRFSKNAGSKGSWAEKIARLFGF